MFPDYPAPVWSDYRLLTFFERNAVKPESETGKKEESYLWHTATTWQTSRVRPSLEKRVLGKTERPRAHSGIRHCPLGSASVASAGSATLNSGRRRRGPAMMETLITVWDPTGTWGHRREGGAGHLWRTSEPTNEGAGQVREAGLRAPAGGWRTRIRAPWKSPLLLAEEAFVDLLQLFLHSYPWFTLRSFQNWLVKVLKMIALRQTPLCLLQHGSFINKSIFHVQDFQISRSFIVTTWPIKLLLKRFRFEPSNSLTRIYFKNMIKVII